MTTALKKISQKTNQALTMIFNSIITTLMYFIGIGPTSIIKNLFQPKAFTKPKSQWQTHHQQSQLENMY